MFVLFVTRHLKTDSKKMYTLNLSQGAHPAGAYPGFHSMKGQGVLLLPPGWMVSPSQGSSHLSSLPPPPLPSISPGFPDNLQVLVILLGGERL